jgi:hypothetical protein
VTVLQAKAPPRVDAGPDQAVVFPAGVALAGSATDDGIPAGASLTYAWTVVRGLAGVSLAAPGSPSTAVVFPAPGVYTLRLSAGDGDLVGVDNVRVVVDGANQPPVVDAGPDQEVPGLLATMAATVLDDGLPAQWALLPRWSLVDGPGTAVFRDPLGSGTTVTFSQPGIYTLRWTASDGQHTRFDDVRVAASLANQPPHVDPGPDQAVLMERNLLRNPGADEPLQDGKIPGWTEVSGAWSPRTEGGGYPPSYDGRAYFWAGTSPAGELVQDVDLGTALFSGETFRFRGRVRSYPDAVPDTARIVVEYGDQANASVLARFDSGETRSTTGWTEVRDERPLPEGTRFVRVRLVATRNRGPSNDGYFDGLFQRGLTSMSTQSGFPSRRLLIRSTQRSAMP